MRVVEELAAATAFLTRVPAGRLAAFDGEAVARAAPFYPVIGAAVGALAGGVVDLAAGPLPALAGAALGLGVAALITGGMHLDALADTADALGGLTRAQRLEIMRDHAIGSFGAVALAVVLLFEASVLAAVPSAWSAFAVAAACGRWAALPLAALLPYARTNGQGAALVALTTPLAGGLALAAVCAIALAFRGPEGLAAIGAAAATGLVLGVFFRQWLGGVTGDTLGATTELAQAAALAALLVVS
jgi:adenosylcobinamide-GDP ribazoletransferase